MIFFLESYRILQIAHGSTSRHGGSTVVPSGDVCWFIHVYIHIYIHIYKPYQLMPARYIIHHRSPPSHHPRQDLGRATCICMQKIQALVDIPVKIQEDREHPTA